MPMKQGTKPRIVQYAEVSRGDLQLALQAAARADIIKSDVEGKRTVWRNQHGAVIARHNIHKKSEQIVIAAHLCEFLPKPRKEDGHVT